MSGHIVNQHRRRGRSEKAPSSTKQEREAEWTYKNSSNVTASRLATPRSIRSTLAHGATPVKVVRVRPQEQKRPFSSYEKHRKQHVGQRPPDPYFTPWEKHIKGEIESRKKWVGGTFVVTDHKATVARREREMAGSSCVAAGGPYKNPNDAFREEDKSKFVSHRNFI